MRSFQFVTIDVSTARAFGGNPLVALPRAGGSSDREMQSLAAGLNLSETTFVLPPADSARMFSPQAGTFEGAATGSAAARRVVDGVRANVSGSCVQMFRGEVALPELGEEPDCVA